MVGGTVCDHLTVVDLATRDVSWRRPDARVTRAVRRWRRWRLHPLLAGIGWATLTVLGAVAIARLVDFDGATLLAEINSTNALAYAPVWVVLPVAAIGRRPVLASVALVVLGAQLAFAAPEVLAARPLPSWAGTSPHLRLFDANAGADGGNTDMAGYAAEIAQVRPELATFEEISPADFSQLEASPALRGLSHRYELEGAAPWGFAVASRYPIHVTHVMWTAGNPVLVALTLDLPEGAIRVWVVHTDAPTLSRALWLSDLERIAHRETMRGTGRLLVVGDFNAGWGNAGFDAVLASGIADAAAARGHPFDMTWPQGDHVPPIVRIDHVLAGTGISTTKIAAVPGPGSDHRALLATIAVHRP